MILFVQNIPECFVSHGAVKVLLFFRHVVEEGKTWVRLLGIRPNLKELRYVDWNVNFKVGSLISARMWAGRGGGCGKFHTRLQGL